MRSREIGKHTLTLYQGALAAPTSDRTNYGHSVSGGTAQNALDEYVQPPSYSHSASSIRKFTLPLVVQRTHCQLTKARLESSMGKTSSKMSQAVLTVRPPHWFSAIHSFLSSARLIVPPPRFIHRCAGGRSSLDWILLSPEECMACKLYALPLSCQLCLHERHSVWRICTSDTRTTPV